MARLFSFRKGKDGRDESRTEQSARTPQRIRQLLSQTKKVFRKSNNNTTAPSPTTPESAHSFRPLEISSLSEETADLQAEIDGELLLLSERTTSSPPEVPTPLSSQHPTSVTLPTLSDSASPANEVTTSATSVAASDTPQSSGLGRSVSEHCKEECQILTRTDDHKRRQYTNEDVDAESSSDDSVVHHLPHSNGNAGAPSFLQAVRSTWSNARARLPSSPETPERAAPTWSESSAYETPPSSWMDRVVDADLREVLVENRARMVQDVYHDAGAIFGSQDTPFPEASGEISRDDTPNHDDEGVALPRSVQPSWQLANARIFPSTIDDELESFDLSGLFSEPEIPEAAQQEEPLSEADLMVSNQIRHHSATTPVFLAQPQSEVEHFRRSRLHLSQQLEVALSEQEAQLRAGFDEELVAQREAIEAHAERCYDSFAQSHEIEFLNLRDDHEAEVKDLQDDHGTEVRGLKADIRDLRARVIDKTKSLRESKGEVKSLRVKCSTIEDELSQKSLLCRQLLQAFHEHEATLQQKFEEVYEVKAERDKIQGDYETWLRQSQDGYARLERSHTTLTDKYNGLLTGFNVLNQGRQIVEAELQGKKDELATANAALQESQQACQELRTRHDHVVAEKAKDFSWHVENRVNASSARPMNTEEQIANATVELREKLEQQTELSANLNSQLESAQASNKAKFKKLKRVIANKGQEKVILEMALGMAQSQRDQWAEEYKQIAEAVANKMNFSSHARGVAERHILLQKRRLDLESQLVEAQLRGDRAVLQSAIFKKHEAIKLEKRDAQIAELDRKLRTMKYKLEYEHSMAKLYKEALDKEVPSLRVRNSEVERLLRDQITNNAHADHQAVFDDVYARLQTQQNIVAFWERQYNLELQEHADTEMQYSFFTCVTFRELTSARNWRDERDALEIEVVALRERFADALLLEPLVIPADKKTRKQIDEESTRLENIDKLLLEQYRFTWGALPKTLVDKYADPWAHVPVDVKEEIEGLRKRWIEERDLLEKSFRDQDEPIPPQYGNDLRLVLWKGKSKATGSNRGIDGQLEFSQGRPEKEAHLVGVAEPSREVDIVDHLQAAEDELGFF